MLDNVIIAGVDEAGRGAVVGPLVACCYAAEEKMADRLADLGVKDSKRLSASSREALLPGLVAAASSITWSFLSPSAIDAENLNTLYTRHVVSLIRISGAGRVLVDAPVSGGGVERYKNYLQSLGLPCLVDACNHAEDASPMVAAASICAKVLRDREIALINRDHGPLGSGYPSDPSTKTWLTRHRDEGVRAGIVRGKWKVSCLS